MCSRRRCRSSIPARRSRSVRRRRTASTTTSCGPSRSRPRTSPESSGAWPRSSTATCRSSARCGTARRSSSTSSITARSSRPSGPTNCPRTRRSLSTSRATGSTCASARTCPRRVNWARAFKLTKVSGAYWRGRRQERQLQRVYGTVFFSDKDLKAYLHRLEGSREARPPTGSAARWACSISRKTRPGWVYWHPKGWTLWRTLENYLRRKLEAGGYVEVKTPQLNDRRLWEASGHWEKFRENMYLSENEEGLREFFDDPTKRVFALKR